MNKIKAAVKKLEEFLPLRQNLSQLTALEKQWYWMILDHYALTGCPPRRVLNDVILSLEELRFILLSKDKAEILGCYPFRHSGTDHKIIMNGIRTGAMCALDPLSMSSSFRTPVEIQSISHYSEKPIKIHIDGTDIKQESYPDEIYVGISWDYPCCEVAAYSICEEAVFIIGKSDARRWHNEHGSRELFTLSEALLFSQEFFLPLQRKT